MKIVGSVNPPEGVRADENLSGKDAIAGPAAFYPKWPVMNEIDNRSRSDCSVAGALAGVLLERQASRGSLILTGALELERATHHLRQPA